MFKKFLLLFSIFVLIPSISFSGGYMERDLDSKVIQGAAPNALLSQLITSTASYNFDLSSILWFSFTPVSDCKGRLQTSSAKGTHPQFTLTAGVPYSKVKHRKTAFFNISGCTGDFQAQD